MQWYRPVKLFSACIWVMALGSCAHTSPKTMERRTNGQPETADRSDSPHIAFGDLHSHFFQRSPFPRAPRGTDPEEMYPDTYFFKGNPVFFTDFTQTVNQNQLGEAYTYFGKVHVADLEDRQYLTISPSFGPPDDRPQKFLFDKGLEEFVDTALWYEKQFGRNAAVLLHGPKMLRPKIRDANGETIPEPVLRWEEIEKKEPTRDLNPEGLRELMRQQGYLKFARGDGRSALDVRFDEDGLLQHIIYSTLRNVGQDARAFI